MCTDSTERRMLTACGIIVMFDRNASKLRESVGMPSYRTVPSVIIPRNNAKVKELCKEVCIKISRAMNIIQWAYFAATRSTD